MSVLTRKAVERNLEAIKRQLSDIGGGDEELKVLEARLATEKDAFIKTLITEKIERLKKQKKEPSQYEMYAAELRDLQKYLQAALTVMSTIPFYMSSNKGKAAKVSSKKK
jgi:hypothetical protein